MGSTPAGGTERRHCQLHHQRHGGRQRSEFPAFLDKHVSLGGVTTPLHHIQSADCCFYVRGNGAVQYALDPTNT